jgi:hypothetical protein
MLDVKCSHTCSLPVIRSAITSDLYMDPTFSVRKTEFARIES